LLFREVDAARLNKLRERGGQGVSSDLWESATCSKLPRLLILGHPDGIVSHRDAQGVDGS
jgi:hypothetical protein